MWDRRECVRSSSSTTGKLCFRIPIAVTKGGGSVTGNIRVSKTVVLGSNPSPLAYGTDMNQYCYCPIAQLVEQQAVNLTVTGSSPVGAVRRGARLFQSRQSSKTTILHIRAALAR